MLKVYLIHASWQEYGDDGRKDTLVWLKSISDLKDEFYCPTEIQDVKERIKLNDCVIVHASQKDDVERIESAIRDLSIENMVPPYCIQLGGPISIPEAKDTICSCDVQTFVTNGRAFFTRWQDLEEFPGWEFLIGAPERECALEILHKFLPSAYGGEPADSSEDWSMLLDLKNEYARRSNSNEIEALWNKVEETYNLCVINPNKDDPISLLTFLRDDLLGNPSIGKQGLVGLLARLRKAS
jgi:hypothetical protein